MAVLQIAGLDALTRELSRQARHAPQLRAAAAKALTATAQAARRDLQTEMSRVFDAPTRWTLNSTWVRPARANRLLTELSVKDRRGTETALSTEDTLRAEISGGNRKPRKFEEELRSLRLGRYYAATRTAPKDRFGNPSQALMRALRADMGLMKANERRTKRTTKALRGHYFAIAEGSDAPLSPGVYRMPPAGGAPEKVLNFIDPPLYRRRLDFYGVVQRSTERRFWPLFDMALRSSFGGE